MPAQPELFLTAQAVDVAGFGEVGGGGFQSKPSGAVDEKKAR